MLANASICSKLTTCYFKEFRVAEESTASTIRTWKMKCVEKRDKSRKILSRSLCFFGINDQASRFTTLLSLRLLQIKLHYSTYGKLVPKKMSQMTSRRML